LQSLESKFSEASMGSLADSIIDSAISGTGDLDLSAYANEIGQREGLLKMYTNDVIQGYQAQADSALKAQGIDLEEFYGFLQEEHPDLLKETIQKHYRTKSPAVWKELIPLYRSSVLPSDEALARAKIPVRQVGNDKIITYKGMTMTLKAAAKAGLL
jgi:hypothetical protein